MEMTAINYMSQWDLSNGDHTAHEESFSRDVGETLFLETRHW